DAEAPAALRPLEGREDPGAGAGRGLNARNVI
ncbi:MAG: hypothetical protein RIR10_1190, partial [Planctomycetota bacterium]